MAPLANNEPALRDRPRLCSEARGAPRWVGFAGCNVSDREVDWAYNYRCPDVAVYLKGNPARDCGTHWYGGPDWGTEITSPGERSRQKLAFYAKVRTRELLTIDRAPWGLELRALKNRRLQLVGRSTVKSAKWLNSKVLPISLRLLANEPRPLIEIRHRQDGRSWRI
jgi:Uma2 family endonuclease